MRLKERAPIQASINPSSVPDKRLSPPPIFDWEKMSRSKEAVDKMAEKGGFGELKALRIALVLSYYNYLVSRDLSQKSDTILGNRINNLINEEITASDPDNPLPTIGVEVETPRKIKRSLNFNQYCTFFDDIGMPRNEANLSSLEGLYWEFSPPPSYSASVQSRIVSELIKGGFIPSLSSSKNPADIIELLDRKLVSLHVNLGIPGDIKNNDLLFYEEVELLAYALSLAFSSSERIANKASNEYFNTKKADKVKGRNIDERLEIKALEVRTESTYRLFKEAQLLGCAMFAYLSSTNMPLGGVWQRLLEEIKPIIKQYPDNIKLIDKNIICSILKETDTGIRLRHIVDRRAIEISRLLQRAK